MEVTSHFIETEDLGSLHFTRFVPPHATAQDLGIHFGGVNSRIATVDTFGTAYIMASDRGMIVDVVDRPGNGSSTLPENSNLREDYMRFGFVAVRDAIMEAQTEDDTFKNASRLHASGMSLGGQVAVQYLDGVDRAGSATLFDSAGLRLKAPKIEAVGRYFFYVLGIELVADKLGRKQSVGDAFSQERGMLEAYTEFMETYQENMPEQKGAGKAEFLELCRLAEGTGPDLAVSLLQDALDDGRPFELRASRSGARVISDNRSVKVINQKFEEFDEANPGVNQPGSAVRYGFSQDGSWWHSLAIAPEAIRRLILPSIDRLRPRLR